MLSTDEGAWLLIDAHVQPITRTQANLLASAAAQVTEVGPATIANYPDLDPPIDLRLPARVPEWLDPATRAICAGPSGGGAAMAEDTQDTEDAQDTGIELSGSAVATHFAGLAAGAVGIDSGSGYHVVTTSGLRHPAPDEETLEIIGVQRVDEAAWSIVSLLPEGEALTRQSALTATY